MRYNIPAGAIQIIHELKKNGHKAYLVGGCVRDLLMGREPHDWDICTSALPDQMKECFGQYKVIETGLKHGTLTVVLDAQAYEVTAFRVDGEYSDGRRPDNVSFTSSLNEDLARRDFTMNAIAMCEDGFIYDPYGGAADIENRMIRCVGRPETRFDEDGLRILRAIRFASVLGFQIHHETNCAIHKCRENLRNVSAERIVTEVKKTLSGRKPGLFLSCYNDELAVFWPEIEACAGFDQKNIHHNFDVWTHICHAIDYADTDDVIVRLALLLHDIGKPKCFTVDEQGRGHFYGHPPVCAAMADDMLRRLKFDNETREAVVQLIEHHDATIVPTEKCVRRWLNKLGEEQFRRFLHVKVGDILAHNPETIGNRVEDIYAARKILKDVLAQKQCFSFKDLAISGRDILALGIPQGQKVGEILKEILRQVIDGEIENDRNALLKKVEILKY